jgi:REP element-mobilizing transposase RayT
MNRGVARATTFFDDVDRVEFGRLIGLAADRFAVEVHAYCLMPNHFHLVLNCPDGGLSAFMQLLTAMHTRHVNERVDRDGPLYRGRFRSLAIGDDGYLLAAVRYVHRNPLPIVGERGLDRYRWSSHRAYLGVRRSPSWLRCGDVLGLLGEDRDRYARFVTADAEPDRLTEPARIPILAAVQLAMEERGDDVQATSRLVRPLALAALDAQHAEPDDFERAGLTFIDERRRSQAVWRARRRVAADPALRRLTDRAVELAAAR